MRAWYLPLMIVLLILPVIPAGAGDTLQDDAGTGGDAGDHRHEAVPVGEGLYDGTLTQRLDTDDYYSFFAQAGSRVTVTIEPTDADQRLSLGDGYLVGLVEAPARSTVDRDGVWVIATTYHGHPTFLAPYTGTYFLHLVFYSGITTNVEARPPKVFQPYTFQIETASGEPPQHTTIGPNGLAFEASRNTTGLISWCIEHEMVTTDAPESHGMAIDLLHRSQNGNTVYSGAKAEHFPTDNRLRLGGEDSTVGRSAHSNERLESLRGAGCFTAPNGTLEVRQWLLNTAAEATHITVFHPTSVRSSAAASSSLRTWDPRWTHDETLVTPVVGTYPEAIVQWPLTDDEFVVFRPGTGACVHGPSQSGFFFNTLAMARPQAGDWTFHIMRSTNLGDAQDYSLALAAARFPSLDIWSGPSDLVLSTDLDPC